MFHELKKESWCDVSIIATGQHYSPELSDVFLKEFSLPTPHFHLGVGEGTSTEQLNKIITEYEKVFLKTAPDLVIVVGDVTSTLAGCLAAKKNNVPVAHVEAGLRSRDLTMPEEKNRIEVDKVADLLFVPSPEAVTNLISEGRKQSDIFWVGNIMIDTYCLLKPKIHDFIKTTGRPFGPQEFALVTLHRPSNVDEKSRFHLIVENLIKACDVLPLVFPVHPRTEKKLKEFNLWEPLMRSQRIKLLPSLGYIEFMSFLEQSCCVVTDSGGIQEESTYLNILCFTLRKNSERPITLSHGSNQLIEPEDLTKVLQDSLKRSRPKIDSPELWDGKTASRIITELKNYFRL